MKTSLVITTINKLNRNLFSIVNNCNKNNLNLVIIGDKKTPKNFKINYGKYLNLNSQKKLNFNFTKICPKNSYARKNIGYLLSFNNSDFIIETDDDNIPKKKFYNKIILSHNVKTIKNNSWINIYDLFTKNKKNTVWPRGLPLDEIFKNKIKISNKKKLTKFYLQQGVAEVNPDVDAIYRLSNNKINIKFKNLKINMGNSLFTLNSQNTIWHKDLFPLMYLPVTCSMRCTDIWRGLIALKIIRFNKLNILFFGTTMFQIRNSHDLMRDFRDEIPMYIYNKQIFKILNKLKLKKGKKFFIYNLKKCYKELIRYKIFVPQEMRFLNAWISDCEKTQIY